MQLGEATNCGSRRGWWVFFLIAFQDLWSCVLMRLVLCGAEFLSYLAG